MSTASRRSSRARVALHGAAQALARHGLQQIVDRAFIEGAQRVFLVCRDEDHLAMRAGRARHFEPAHAGHADVEERDIGLVLLERLRARPVRPRTRPRRSAPARAPPAARATPAAAAASSSAMMAVGRVMRVRGSSGTTSRASTPPALAFRQLERRGRAETRQQLRADVGEPGAFAHAELQSPAPSSSTRTSRRSIPRHRARGSMTRVTPGFGSTPCLMAFSTSEMSSSGGNGDIAQLGAAERARPAAVRPGAAS